MTAVALAMFLAACGEEGSTSASNTTAGGEATAPAADMVGTPAAQLTRSAVRQCILDDGGQSWPMAPIEPRNVESPKERVFAIGPDRGHILIMLSVRPSDAKQLAREYNEIGEFDAFAVRGGRVLVLIDETMTKKDEAVAYACAGVA